MELKKSKEANLENKSKAFFFLGLVIIASVVGMAFQFQQFTADEYVAVKQKKTLSAELNEELPVVEDIPEEEVETPPPPMILDEIEQKEDEIIVPDIDLSGLGELPDVIPENKPEAPKKEEIIDVPEVEPEFPGGEAAMAEWIQKNIVYPPMSVEMGEQGVVYVQFVVNSDGSIEQVKTVRGVSDAIDKEAQRIVKRMPKWKPGEQQGKKVRVRFVLPINFRLG
ncbi:energy transducer TonB [Crocinitomix catalasitica]|uniref:energy transducer TonB n=1 Tax=Crocinitomix catalasitica TaxID=184607 RepID=UPI0004824873|nr:energy transducer TonB [Crocinitomix catalasitica]